MSPDSPLPLLPTNLKSLNLATWFLNMAVQLRSSPQEFSSFPALTWTTVPSLISHNMITLKATGNVLLDLQWEGRAEQTRLGQPVLTNSPGWSFITSFNSLSPGQGMVLVSPEAPLELVDDAEVDVILQSEDISWENLILFLLSVK